MAKETLPITPAVLSWARERAGYSLQEAAATFKKIAAWEAGEAAPTYPQLEALADKFELPVAAFFFPEPPTLPQIRESFRTLPDAEYNKLPPTMLSLLRKGKAMQLNLAELCDGVNPAERLITRDLAVDERAPVESSAASIREFLGVTLEEQYAWRDGDVALKAWRRAAQNVGVFVFKDAFREDAYSGFSLFDNVFPVIFLNNSNAKTRQIFTLFHELAHLLFHTSGIDTPDEHHVDAMHGHDKSLELLCNSLAAHALVPNAAFASAVDGQPHSEYSAERIADRFGVSREMIYRKFLDRGWISQDAYWEAARKWSSQLQRGEPGGDYYWTKIAYLGSDYIDLALKRYSQNKIDEERLGDYLDTKPRNIGILTDRLQRTAR
jgi:Zn-dependent peptidase ImmA (M78 family)